MNTIKKLVAVTALVAVVAVSGCNVFRGQSTAGNTWMTSPSPRR